MPKSWILAAGVASSFLISAAYADPMIGTGNRELSLHISPDFEGAIGDTGYSVTMSSAVGDSLLVQDAKRMRYQVPPFHPAAEAATNYADARAKIR